MNHGLPVKLPCFCITHAAFRVFHHYIGQYSFYLPFNPKKQVVFPWLGERVDLSSCNWEMNASGEWDINNAYLSLCRVGMTRQSDSSIVFRWKKPVKFARALHRDRVPLRGQQVLLSHCQLSALRNSCVSSLNLWVKISDMCDARSSINCGKIESSW